MTIGLYEYRNDETAEFVWSLLLPFRKNSSRQTGPNESGASPKSEPSAIKTD
jgi:hypothetical protein